MEFNSKKLYEIIETHRKEKGMTLYQFSKSIWPDKGPLYYANSVSRNISSYRIIFKALLSMKLTSIVLTRIANYRIKKVEFKRVIDINNKDLDIIYNDLIYDITLLKDTVFNSSKNFQVSQLYKDKENSYSNISTISNILETLNITITLVFDDGLLIC